MRKVFQLPLAGIDLQLLKSRKHSAMKLKLHFE